MFVIFVADIIVGQPIMMHGQHLGGMIDGKKFQAPTFLNVVNPAKTSKCVPYSFKYWEFV